MFIRETARYYPSIAEAEIRVVLIHPDSFLLPELGEELGLYAERQLRARKVYVVKGVRVASYDGSIVTLSDGTSIPASTLVWTAGVKPSAVIRSLPCEKERGRVRVNEYLAVPGVSGLWAAGDCAAVPDVTTGTFYPPTAQHGLREGVAAAKNIEAAIAGRALEPFRYRAMGLLASIGHHTGVAMVFGVKFSGFIAWWRSVAPIAIDPCTSLCATARRCAAVLEEEGTGSALVLRRVLGRVRLVPVVPEVGRSYYQAETALQALDLIAAPESGSNWLCWWRRWELNPRPETLSRRRLRR